MNWQQIITTVIEICILPLLGVLTKVLISYLSTKSKEITNKTDNELVIKYINMLTETISSCVVSTNQTFVDVLKANGEFSKEAQQEAFQKTYDNVMNILSADCKTYLESAFGDLETYITNRIEAEVKLHKN